MKEHELIEYGFGRCDLGLVLVARSNKGVCAVLIGDEENILKKELMRRIPKARILEEKKGIEKVIKAVCRSAEGTEEEFNYPLDMRGTTFQVKVWKALCEIRCGMTASYRDIAKKIGSPRSIRAVAGACAANHLALIVPCHRVICSDGSISGYRWGLERKRKLLSVEESQKRKRTMNIYRR